MKYGSLILQSWQILKRTRLLWFFGLVYSLPPLLSFWSMGGLALTCVGPIIGLLSSFLYLFSMFGLTLCTQRVLQEVVTSLKDVWTELINNFGRLILFSLFSLVPIAIVFLCSAFSLGLAYVVADAKVDDMEMRMLLATWLATPFVSGILNFGFYGLIIHKLGILKSLFHGLTVFAMNWFKYLVLYSVIESPVWFPYLLLVVILSLRGESLNIENFAYFASFLPFRLWKWVASPVVFVFSSVTYLLAYHRFIRDFDYPALRQAAGEK